MYSLLRRTQLWSGIVVRYLDIYWRLAEGKACLAFVAFLFCCVRFIVFQRSWITAGLGLLFLCAAKWLAQGKWVEALLSPGAIEGKTLVLVGASRGIGLYVAKQLASRRPSRVIIGIRGEDKRLQDLASLIKDSASALETKITVLPCDLMDLKSVVRFVDMVKREVGEGAIDVLLCNAGCLAPVDWTDHRVTPDGFEMSWQSNILGHFIISEELIPLLLRSHSSPRLIHMSSIAHTWTLADIDYSSLSRVSTHASEHNPVKLYAWSKLAQIFHVQDLHERFGSLGVIACAVHPGIVRTEIHQRSVSLLVGTLYKFASFFTGKSIAEGAQPVLWCIAGPGIQGGAWYHDCKPCRPSLAAQSPIERKKCLLWLSEARRCATPRSLCLRSTTSKTLEA